MIYNQLQRLRIVQANYSGRSIATPRVMLVFICHGLGRYAHSPSRHHAHSSAEGNKRSRWILWYCVNYLRFIMDTLTIQFPLNKVVRSIKTRSLIWMLCIWDNCITTLHPIEPGVWWLDSWMKALEQLDRDTCTAGWRPLDSWMEALGQLDGGHWTAGWRPLDSWMEAFGQLDGGHWTAGWRPLNSWMEALGQLDGGSCTAGWKPLESCMEALGQLNGGPWTAGWRALHSWMEAFGKYMSQPSYPV